MHADAPSRSALKPKKRRSPRSARMNAVACCARARGADLGAAPWLTGAGARGLHVTAIDNGSLRQHLLDSGRVDHLRADGFQWQPKAPLDWMVCDMVEQPRCVAERMATWLREGCAGTRSSTQLPMKKRWDETRLCLELFKQQARKPLLVRARRTTTVRKHGVRDAAQLISHSPRRCSAAVSHIDIGLIFTG
jgi:23S rRNA (cytidine2498-2'-O)-methyltransferase